MRRLIIHTGMAKAGSTAIQKALLQQEDALKDLNILNPTTGRRRGAHWGLVEEVRDQKPSILFPQTAAESREYPVTVISCEAFWLFQEDAISRLAEAAADWDDVHIVMYLRHPGSFLGSSYRMHIRTGKVSGSPEEFVAKTEPRLAYDKMVARWSHHFPITVKVYDLVRSSIERDFFETIGAGQIEVQRAIANGTPCDGATRVMRMTNSLLSKRSRRNRINRNVLTVQRYFAWLPPIDNTAFYESGARAAARWDPATLSKYLNSTELETLTRPIGT